MFKQSINSNYTQIYNKIITDKAISETAFRVYCYLMSKPDGWNFFNEEIMKSLGITNRNKLSKALKELIENGYITRIKVGDKVKKIFADAGYEFKLGSYIYFIFVEKIEEIEKLNKGLKELIKDKNVSYKKIIDYINKRKYQNTIISETDINGNKYDALNNKDNNKKELNKKINNKENINNSETTTKNTSKGEEKSKQENSKTKENLQNLIFFIKSFLKEKNIILSPKQNFLLENIILSLSKTYSLEEIKEVLEFAKEHSFYSKFLANPKALENNFNSIRLEYLQQKEKEEENTFFFGLGG